MELRNLITFIHIAELGSFTRAAQQLGYSQSTVSAQIKQLETADLSQEQVDLQTPASIYRLCHRHRIFRLTSFPRYWCIDLPNKEML